VKPIDSFGRRWDDIVARLQGIVDGTGEVLAPPTNAFDPIINQAKEERKKKKQQEQVEQVSLASERFALIICLPPFLSPLILFFLPSSSLFFSSLFGSLSLPFLFCCCCFRLPFGAASLYFFRFRLLSLLLSLFFSQLIEGETISPPAPPVSPTIFKVALSIHNRLNSILSSSTSSISSSIKIQLSIVSSGKQVLNSHPPEVRKIFERIFEERGIEMVMGSRALGSRDSHVFDDHTASLITRNSK
jgi:hypothetical protein